MARKKSSVAAELDVVMDERNREEEPVKSSSIGLAPVEANDDAYLLAVKMLSRIQIVRNAGGHILLHWRGMRIIIERDLATPLFQDEDGLQLGKTPIDMPCP